MMNCTGIDGRSYVLVTGASSGIGKAVCQKLAANGTRLVLVGRKEEALQAVVEVLPGKSEHLTVKCDLENLAEIPALFDLLQQSQISLSGLVHSAGVSPIAPLRTVREHNVQAVMNINFLSFLALVRGYAYTLKAQGGSIVAISSSAAVSPEKGQIAYAASKAALDAAVNVAAQELAPRQIRVNSVRPGLVLTDMTKRFAAKNEQFLKKQEEKQVLGLGMPDDVANFVEFLLSDRSSWCTGRTYSVDGGRVAY